MLLIDGAPLLNGQAGIPLLGRWRWARATGDSANHGTYNKVYDQYLKDGNAAAARNAIGAQFGRSEITSATKQPYATYYGDR